jgi:hypothetical protein
MHVMADLEAVADTAIREFGARQDPRELTQFLSWLQELREPPRYVVEVGVYRGGHLWAMQQALPDARFVGVDYSFRYLTNCVFKAGTLLVCGKSAAVAEQVRGMYEPDHTLVYIDADHGYAGVSRDARLYPARYQAFHDINDTRSADQKQLVCHFYREHQAEFPVTFCNQPNTVGIGVRVSPSVLQ